MHFSGAQCCLLATQQQGNLLRPTKHQTTECCVLTAPQPNPSCSCLWRKVQCLLHGCTCRIKSFKACENESCHQNVLNNYGLKVELSLLHALLFPSPSGWEEGGGYSFVFKHFINVYKRIQTCKQNKDETLAPDVWCDKCHWSKYLDLFTERPIKSFLKSCAVLWLGLCLAAPA